MMQRVIWLSLIAVAVRSMDGRAQDDELRLETASHFHSKLLDAMDDKLELVYEGPLGKHKRPGLQPVENLTSWSICKKSEPGALQEEILRFTLSTSNEPHAVGTCEIDGKTLFIVIDFVSNDRTVNSELEEFSGKTFLKFLSEVKGLNFKSDGKKDNAQKPGDGDKK